jgi:hypothetical protein
MQSTKTAEPRVRPEPAQRPPLWAYADSVVLAQLAIENNGNN